jgi:hypothetical protein
MSIDEIIERLCDASHGSFLRALGDLNSVLRMPSPGRVDFLATFFDRLARVPLSDSEYNVRVRQVIQRSKIDDVGLRTIAEVAAKQPSAIKLAVLAALPQDARAIVYRDTSSSHSASKRTDIDGRDSGSGTRSDGNSNTESSGKVILLAASDSQEGNTSLLASTGFESFRIGPEQNLREVLCQVSDLCACLVDGTYLRQLNHDDQAGLFQLLAEHSSFWWIRIDENHLLIEFTDLIELIKRTRCRRVVSCEELSLQPDGTLRSAEVSSIRRSSSLLRSVDHGRFLLGEISAQEAQVLMAAATTYAVENHGTSQIDVKSLRARFLHDGRSGQKIAVLRINDFGSGLIAKVGGPDEVMDEARRFRYFIQPWDQELRPVVQFHGSSAVILFGLISEDLRPTEPAPTLESQLQALWRWEVWGDSPGMTRPDPSNIKIAIQSAVEKLACLNKRRHLNSGFENFSRPHMECFSLLEASGVKWSVAGDESRLRKLAADAYDARDGLAVVHGDVHLKNILVRSDRQSFLIDYAFSGPGHPAVDLVRLELALLFRTFRQTAGSESIVRFQQEFSVERRGVAELEVRFPELYGPETNRVCLDGMIRARDAAIDVIESFGGGLLDYHAAKYLWSWRSLTMSDLQASLARDVVGALGQSISGLA